MAAKAFRPFQNGFRLIDGFKLNQLFTGGMSFVAALVNSTVSGRLVTSPQILAAAGASQGNASLITAYTVIVTVTASTQGVKLPTAATGQRVQVFCPGTVGVKVYPFTGDKISTASTNAAVALVADKANIYVAKDQTTWAVQKGA